ncbi:hypothetical protein M408DRAFT_111137 [Serendipita vermifera MAFF 305830]|uniref:Uncharacterized protein n=1 Tax=Serendipita vermifera MAFF 305830 TaxID=933852 RepID=A0A0C2WUS9_SERVB|nr:hypothetical protein M408DRAFT_111137 [Serendipita vermifera MAFF 305830]
MKFASYVGVYNKFKVFLCNAGVNEQSTYGDVQTALREDTPNLTCTLLQPKWGAKPNWIEADSSALIGQMCQDIYVVVKGEDSSYILGMVRTTTSDYPLPIYNAGFEATATLSQAITAIHPKLANQVKSITNYSDDREMKDGNYSFTSLERYQTPEFPAVVIHLDEPSKEFKTQALDNDVPPLLQGAFIYCKFLLQNAYGLDDFGHQMVHLTSALLHIIISSAPSATPLSDGSEGEGSLFSEDQVENIRLATTLARDIERHLDNANSIMENIRTGAHSREQSQEEINKLFTDICGDHPGGSTVRDTYSTFQALGQLDQEEDSRALVAQKPPSRVAQGILKKETDSPAFQDGTRHDTNTASGQGRGAGTSSSSFIWQSRTSHSTHVSSSSTRGGTTRTTVTASGVQVKTYGTGDNVQTYTSGYTYREGS